MNASTTATPPPFASPLQVISLQPALYNCIVSLPHTYAAEPRRAWPLLIFLHGAGERGADIWAAAKHGPMKLLQGAAELNAREQESAAVLASSFIVVAPQCPHYEVWDDGAVTRLLDHFAAELRVDRSRVYLTGMSMGGFGTWSLAMRRPQLFAAIAPICGGGRIADIHAISGAHDTALRRLGIWAFHGAQDRVVPLAESQRMVDALIATNVADVQFTVYPDAEHDAWTATYANRELYAWLLRHTH